MDDGYWFIIFYYCYLSAPDHGCSINRLSERWFLGPIDIDRIYTAWVSSIPYTVDSWLSLGQRVTLLSYTCCIFVTLASTFGMRQDVQCKSTEM